MRALDQRGIRYGFFNATQVAKPLPRRLAEPGGLVSAALGRLSAAAIVAAEAGAPIVFSRVSCAGVSCAPMARERFEGAWCWPAPMSSLIFS